MLFSIIIVNCNGKKYLLNCLQSIFKNAEKSFEIIIVDNHSSDDSISAVKTRFQKKLKKIHIIELGQNLGPAKARNQAIMRAKGKYLALLDNDTEVHQDWLISAKKSFAKDEKIGCIQSKLLLLNDKTRFDYAGDYLNQYGLLSHRATYQDKDCGQFEKTTIIFAAKSAGMFIRKNLFELTGGFDEDYFIYMEETDLCWRTWLLGYKCVYLPTSIVFHAFSGSFKILPTSLATYNLRFHGTKNYILTNIKNLSTIQLTHVLPKLIIIYLCFSLYILFIKLQPKNFFYMLGGILWNIINIKKTLKKRRTIQEKRLLSDKELFPYIYRKTSFLDKINKSIFLKTYETR